MMVKMLRKSVIMLMLLAEIWPLRMTVVEATTNTKYYRKVVSTFPTDLPKCLLDSVPLTSRIYCGSLCNLRETCWLFCTDGSECLLYNAKVSLHWAGEPTATPSGFQCYSSYADPRDVAYTATLTSSPPLDYLDAVKAVNGYYCFKMNHLQYTSQTGTQPWWAANLGSPRKVLFVMVGVGKSVPTKFSDVVVRVGNTTGSGVFTANLVLDTYPGEALAREVVIFSANGPIVGSFVSIQTVSGTDLGVNAVQIIAE